MKLNIYPKVLFRIPQFPLNTTLEKAWPELKSSIKDTSYYFYNIIKDLAFEDIANQPQQVRFTIDKYFNRSRFRATPYGTFAGIGICELTTEQPSSIKIDTNRKLHEFVDWKEAIRQNWKLLPQDQLLLQTNDSYYRYRDTFRYIYKNEERFELSEMPYYPQIEAILASCRQATSYSTLLLEIELIGLKKEELLEIVTELVESQLLYTNYHPNIIGQDYFTRIGQALPPADQQLYTICTNDVLDGALNRNDFDPIKEVLQFLHTHMGNFLDNNDLNTFKKKFRSKYDMAVIPIMEALDPILGVGFGNMESEFGKSDIVSKIAALKGTVNSFDQNANLKQYLLHELSSSGKSIIDLTNFKSKIQQDQLPLPNTFSALVTKAGQHLVVEHLGGATGTALLGRFSLASGEVHQVCAKMAEIEQEANPDIIFFDIAYMGEPTVDNVNRRLQIYDHNISICCWNNQGSKIGLDDIYLIIRGDDIILHSKSLNKRLIPRLSTAYNFSRSDLSIFRLLCDIQTQGIVTNLVPDLQTIFPNADHYPRLIFKNVILAREAWRIKYKPEFEQSANFKTYIEKHKLTRFIKVGYSDQTVRLDTEEQNDRNLLSAILKARAELIVSEVLPESDAIIHNKDGYSFASEFIISIVHKEKIYRDVQLNYEIGNQQRNFPPGSEWIYFNLYCNNSISNEILNCHIEPVLHMLQPDLAGWFFIRYDEGGDHIRLRLKPKEPLLFQRVFQQVSEILIRLMDQGLVQDIQLATYKRELERYSHAGMPEIESHFSVDSRYALWLINKNYSDVQLYWIVSQCMLKVGTELFGRQDLLPLIKTTLAAFQSEHTTNSSIYKQLNQAYRNSRVMATILDLGLTHSFIKIISRVKVDARYSLFTDLFHMHINRLFPQQQRIHEYIIYEYLALALIQRIQVPMVFS